MNYGLYLSASALRVNEHRQDVIANNLANVNTASFKRDLAVVRSRQSAPEELDLPIHLVAPVLDSLNGGQRYGGTFTDFTQGPLQSSLNDYDLAIDGEGFFAVQNAGQVHYTRDGRLTRDENGFLATASGGHRLLDDTGRPIQLPAGRMAVSADGTIQIGDFTAQLAIVKFDRPQALNKLGQNLYSADANMAAKPSAATVRQQFTEGSSVEPTTALVEMLSVQRAYDMAARMIRMTDTILGRAVNDIARLG